MFKCYELHNHTDQSDASLTCHDLIEYMLSDRVDCFAITDHNTISGHQIIQRLINDGHCPISFIKGMEYTTYYGHILCFSLEEYVPWEDIDFHKPELLFKAIRAKGAVAGIAHPFSYGDPFARGCRFDMTVHDYSVVDFIEIFNDLEPLHEVNGKGLQMWEELIHNGQHIAATCGMDLHGKWSMTDQFTTYADGTPDGNCTEELSSAIRSQQTYISKGMLVICDRKEYSHGNDLLHFTLKDMNKPGFIPASEKYLIKLSTSPYTEGADDDMENIYTISEGTPVTVSPDDIHAIHSKAVTIRLYRDKIDLEHLICAAPPLWNTCII